MVVYELSHVFFRYADELIHSPKNLGLYYSYESVMQAVRYFCTQPGFCDNLDAFSAKERSVYGKIINNTIFEAIIYLHSEDYKFETDIELGLYGDECAARNRVTKYCLENTPLVNAKDIVVEKIVNKCIVERREWSEGFSISADSTQDTR